MLCDLSSPRASGVFAYMYLTQCLSLSLFGASAAAYLGDIIPALNSHWARVIVGVTLLTFFYVVNLMGVDIMAKAQKMMTWLLIAALILFAIVGIFKMKLPIFDFSDPNFAINGWGITFNNGQISGGFLGAVLLFVYSTQGYYMTTAYGRDSKDARKDIPFVLLLCVPTLCILYVGVAMAGVGVMSVEEYGNSTTLVFAAQRIFPTWLFYFFIIGQSCDDGWLPKSFGKKNKSGARPYILTFMYVVGIIPIVFGLSITTITNMVQLITSAFAILNFTAEIEDAQKISRCLEAVSLPCARWLVLHHLLCFSGAVPGRSVEEPALHEHRPGCHQRCGHRHRRPHRLLALQDGQHRDPHVRMG